MQWKLSEEQQDYQQALRGWLEDAASSEQVRAWQDAGDSTQFAEALSRAGMTGVGIAEEAGGQGGGVIELALTAEELGRVAAPSDTWLAAVLSSLVLAERPDLVEAGLAGRPTVLLLDADEPPEAASGLHVEDGRVSGSVSRVLAGADAAVYVVVLGGHDDRRLALVDAEADGISVVRRKLLDRSRAVADVTLDGVETAPLEADAGECLARVGDVAAVLVAADSLGASQRMLDLAVEYSRQRHQFGVPIGSFQAVKHAAATMLVGIEASRSGVYLAAASVQAGSVESSMHAAAIKAQVTAEGARTADSALTVHGAIGYTWEHDLHLFYKRAKLDEALYGRPTVWNDRLADALALT